MLLHIDINQESIFPQLDVKITLISAQSHKSNYIGIYLTPAFVYFDSLFGILSDIAHFVNFNTPVFAVFVDMFIVFCDCPKNMQRMHLIVSEFSEISKFTLIQD